MLRGERNKVHLQYDKVLLMERFRIFLADPKSLLSRILGVPT